jgi:hypothetical protein
VRRASARVGTRRSDGAVGVLIVLGIVVWVAARVIAWLASHWWLIALIVAVGSGIWAAVRYWYGTDQRDAGRSMDRLP